MIRRVAAAALAVPVCLYVCGAPYAAAAPPVDVPDAVRAKFDEAASGMANPCGGAAFADYGSLLEVYNSGDACYASVVLAGDLVYFLASGVAVVRAVSVVTGEYGDVASPAVFDTLGRPRLGDAGAPVELVVFGDFQCPYCASASKNVHDIYDDYGGRVSVVFKHLPLVSIHAHAAGAALVGAFAQTRGRFWEVHDYMYANRSSLGPGMMASVLEGIGASASDLFDPQKGRRYADVVVSDMHDAERAGVGGTPSFFINGVRCPSNDVGYLRSRIDLELAAIGAGR